MITLLIPTINRFSFIKKYLIYLQAEGFNGQVLIGDSSDKSNFDATQKYIESNEFSFEISQYAFPNMYPHQCIKKMLKDIKFPFSMFICDDDILVLNTLKKCLKFLENNPSYSGVGGISVLAKLDTDNYNNVVSTYVYRVREMVCQSASERVIDLFSDYSVVNYALARTEQFKCRWPDDPNGKNYDKAIGTEILPCAILAAQGKVKMLDELFCVRQAHEDRIILPSFFDTVMQPQWADTLNFAIEKLSNIVSSYDQITYNKANMTVTHAWTSHLNKWARSSLSNAKLPLYKKISIKVKRLFGVKIHLILSRIYGRLMLILNKKYDKSLNLSALLKPSSRHYAEFKKIYDVIRESDK